MPSPSPTPSLTPHGPGFSFIDTAELLHSVDQGQRTAARATKFLDPNLPFFAHHFPEQPLMPGVLMIEAAAQAAGWLWSSATRRAGEEPQPLHLASVLGFRFLSPALPGETLLMEVSLDKELGTLAQFSATLRVGDRRVAEGRLTLSRT